MVTCSLNLTIASVPLNSTASTATPGANPVPITLTSPGPTSIGT